MRKLLLPVVAALACSTGCYTQGDLGTGVSYSAGYASPDLYYYGPGVSVVAYSDDPIFYSDNYYWRYGNDGQWYRSNYYNSGWGVAYDVPYGVRSIDRPQSYAHFTPGQGWSRVNAGGGYNGGPTVRDHRGGYNGGYSARTQPVYSAPQGRDHRTYSAPQPSYTAPARSYGGGNRGGGPVVRDHRR